MDYRATTEFGILAGELLADLERLRPGIPENSSQEEIRRLYSERIRLRLPEFYREYQADASDGEDAAQLALYQREMEQLLLPRYLALTERQNQLERRSGAGGGALYNRITYSALFFVIGLYVVYAPWIPLWDKWIPFLMAFIAPLVSPWLPDLYQILQKRRHAVALGVLHMDLDQAGRSLPLPPAALPAATTPAATAGGEAARAAAKAAETAQSRKQ